LAPAKTVSSLDFAAIKHPTMNKLKAVLYQLPWAVSAMVAELVQFRFDYPIEYVDEAHAPGSLHYYLFSDKLFLDQLDRDAAGVVVRNYRAQGAQYNPVFIAWWALVNLERHLKRGDPQGLQNFNIQVRWLLDNAVPRQDGAVVWPYNFDWQEGRCCLKAPWISAMSQGLAVSVLVRAHRLTKNAALLSLCERAVKVFEITVEQGGVKTYEGANVLYEEYPGYPLARVLDGFLFSLLGLYDLASEIGSVRVRRLFDDGVAGLKVRLRDWDYRSKWTWYGKHGYLCPPHYHCLNTILLHILARLTGDEVLKETSRRWRTEHLSFFDKSEIFVMFAVTKNLARLRLPRN
jgi:hypothetical protein